MKRAYICPNCRQELELPEETQAFEFLFMSHVKYQECNASILIENDVPRLDEPGTEKIGDKTGTK